MAVSPSGPAQANTVPGAPGCPILPADNVWHADISTLPVHPRSAAWLSHTGGAGRRLHPDFGPSFGEQPVPYGIPYTVVDGSHPKVNVAFGYATESDPGPYPFGPDTPIEGGQDAGGDRHALMLDQSTCVLYELFAAFWSADGSTAGSGAVFDLRSNALRPSTWTSADAAGLPILPGLLRLDEVRSGNIDHAIRMTVQTSDQSFLWPARHQAGGVSSPDYAPMGARFRLKSSFDVSRFRPDTQVVLRAMQRHGLIVADNGSDWFFSGTSEDGWDTGLLDELKSITAGSFEAVDESSLMVDLDSGQTRAGSTGPPPAPPFTGIDVPRRELHFAEGTTRPGFQEYLTVANPSASADATIAIDYLFTGAPPITVPHSVPAGTRLTVNVNTEAGAGKDVAARIRVTAGPGVAAERPLYVRADVAGLAVDGGHDAAAVTGAASRWLFAEGTTRPGFQEYLTVANPSTTATANVRILYPGSPGAATNLSVPPASRATVDVNREVGPGRDVSVDLAVVSGPSVIAERPLYFGANLGLGPVVSDASVSPGALAPAADWYFAEGSTRSGFREFLTIENPSTTDTADVRIDYQGAPGAVTRISVPPAGRATVDVNSEVGPERDVSAAVHVVAGAAVVAERPVYFVRSLVGSQIVNGGHDALGSAGPAPVWLFAEGSTRPGLQEYLTLQNPSSTAAQVAVYYRVAPGQVPASGLYTVQPVSRLTIDVNRDAGAGKDLSVVIQVLSGPPVVAERPLYFVADVGAGLTNGGSVSPGIRP